METIHTELHQHLSTTLRLCGEGRSPARPRINANFGVRSGHELHADVHGDILVFVPFQEEAHFDVFERLVSLKSIQPDG